MERIIWTHQSDQPFYVFDGRHIVHFWDDGVSIHAAAKHYADTETRLSPFEGPHIYPKALPLAFYRSVVLQRRLPLTIELSGDNLGSVKRTAAYVYGEPEIGAFKRRIVRQHTHIAVGGGTLLFRFEIEASPVDPQTAQRPLGDDDKLSQRHSFEFAFPLDLVPEVLNLTDSERRVFDRASYNA